MYHCRSDTKCVQEADDIMVSSTFMLENSTTLAVMYGCTPTVMTRTELWLNHLKELGFHPMTLPIIFAENERKRLLDVFSSHDDQVQDRILEMKRRIEQDSKEQTPRLKVEDMTHKDCESTESWLSISLLKGGLGSLKTQLESMARHSRMLSATVFTEPEGDHKILREVGDKLVARLEEMIAEIEGKVIACDGLLGGMKLSMQTVSRITALPSTRAPDD